ncbi:MAG: DNA mismatch repair endonuclease MutL [Clostridia bacterium]|nr:DNA mismatch repair endonuclease MutL [Clostridia bacterium]
MAKIQVLDKHVAELIAAGEVVERPASVVKEMVENAIDAGAKHVTVEIRDGGVTYIRITDDGSGIHREDVATAFLRHATSKVRNEEDLYAISTLGFRGEALASIAAVARVELTTCVQDEIVGTRYVIHGGEEILVEDAGCPEGSTFIIEDLFYNIPARMKFLKKDVSEGNAVAGVMERLALSHPEIAMRFIRDGRNEIQTSGDGDLLNCIHAVFGKPFAAGMVPVDYSMGGVQVSGYICKPEACRANRTMQHYFINGRYVKTQTAMVALERAYKGVIMVGRFPSCVLCLTLPAETVDANVHPAKIEVRFINEKPVFDAVYYGVKSALESGDRIRRVLLKEEQARPQPIAPPTPAAKPSIVPPAPTPIVSVPKAPPVSPAPRRSFLDLVVDDDRPQDLSLHDDGKPLPLTPPEPVSEVQSANEPSSLIAAPATEPTSAVEQELIHAVEQPPLFDNTPIIRVIGEVFNTYILAQMNDSLYIIDKHAAHERILYNQLKASARVDEQVLLAPISITVSREEHTALVENQDVLSGAGITLEDFGGNSVLVRSFPMILLGQDIEATIQEIAAGLASGGQEVLSAKLDWIYHSTACRAATKGGDVSRPEELEEIAGRVLSEENIRYCPHGRPVCVEMTRKELEKQFGRIL